MLQMSLQLCSQKLSSVGYKKAHTGYKGSQDVNKSRLSFPHHKAVSASVLLGEAGNILMVRTESADLCELILKKNPYVLVKNTYLPNKGVAGRQIERFVRAVVAAPRVILSFPAHKG